MRKNKKKPKVVTATTDNNYCLPLEDTVEVEIDIFNQKLVQWLYLTAQITKQTIEEIIIESIQLKLILDEENKLDAGK